MFIVRTLLWSMLLLVSSVSVAENSRPNILLILADDVGSDAIGCYGGQSYPTLHIDALARDGMKFTHAFSQPVCHPTRVCLMTGRYPIRFGAEGSKWGGFPKAAEGSCIGDRMRDAGYATAVAGKWQLCLMKNDLDHPRQTGFDQWCLFGWHEGGRYNDPLIYQNGKLREDTVGKFGPDLYVDFLIDFMKQSQQDQKPFFAYYSMALCHDVTDDLKGRHVAYYKNGRWMTYAEMIVAMDDMVGRLVAALDEMGVREETLVIFTTDNGTAGASYLKVGPDGRMIRPKVVSVRDGEVVPGGKGKLDDTGTRVPFIANWPGTVAAGTQSDALVDMTDLLPTLAEIGGLTPAIDLDGISFAPILFGRDRAHQRPWVYTDHRGRRCVRSRDWKLYGDGRFFDLRRDPREQRPLDLKNLSSRESQSLAELSEALEQLTRQ